ncbi:MAG: hypothetical protein VX223_16850 [Myxococcota bacterium]|nr:hypothetical protein [Myxococcota bacterium]
MDNWGWIRSRIKHLSQYDPTIEALLDGGVVSPAPRTTQGPRLTRAPKDALQHPAIRSDPGLYFALRQQYAAHRLHMQLDVKGSKSTIQALSEALPVEVNSATESPAVALLTRDRCALQGLLDGPQSSTQRLKMATETLAELTNGHPAYDPLQAQMLNAHIDAGHSEKALQHASDYSLTDPSRTPLSSLAYADACISSMRYQDATTTLQEFVRLLIPKHLKYRIAIYISRAQLGQNAFQAAAMSLPSAEDVLRHPCAWEPWCRAKYTYITETNAGLSDTVRKAFAYMATTLHRRHAFWPAAMIASRLMALELRERNIAYATAAHCLLHHAVKHLAPETQVQLPLNTLESTLLQKQSTQKPLDADAARLRLSEDLSVDELFSIQRQFPGWWQVTDSVAMACSRVGYIDYAIARYEDLLPLDEPNTLRRLLPLAASHGYYAKLSSYLTAHAHIPINLRAFYRSLIAEQSGDLHGALHALTATSSNARNDNRRIELLCRMGRDRDALSCLHQITAAETGNTQAHWDRIVLATRLGEWAYVRESGYHLEMRFERDSGPIEEHWGTVIIQFPDNRPLIAERTGPATARILPVLGEDEPELHAATVLFQPTVPKSPGPPIGGIFLEVLEPSQWSSFSVRGLHPGADAVRRLRSTLEQAGFSTWVWSQAHTALPDGRPMLYLAVGVPHDTPASTLFELLEQQNLEQLVWTALTKQCGTEAQHLQQLDTAHRSLGLRP